MPPPEPIHFHYTPSHANVLYFPAESYTGILDNREAGFALNDLSICNDSGIDENALVRSTENILNQALLFLQNYACCNNAIFCKNNKVDRVFNNF